MCARQVDAVGEVRRLYAWLGEPVSDEFETRMRAWWAENADKREQHPQADAEIFGLELDRVRPLFDRYVTRAQRWVAQEK